MGLFGQSLSGLSPAGEGWFTGNRSPAFGSTGTVVGGWHKTPRGRDRNRDLNEEIEMNKVGRAMLLRAGHSGAQEPGCYQPAATNVYGMTYPRLEAAFIDECPTIY